MAELLERVRTTLMGRSSVERQLGVGGMVADYAAGAPPQRRHFARTALASRFSTVFAGVEGESSRGRPARGERRRGNQWSATPQPPAGGAS